MTSSVPRVPVDTPGGTYEIHVGRGLLGRVGEIAVAACGARHFALVTDKTVGSLFADTVAGAIRATGARCDVIEIPPGESSKSWERAGEVLEALAGIGLDRSGAVVALGGGVVGDLAGFCAGVYMRGVGLVQVPTTLLGQVDSSVGGKTAVDLAAGKNLAGVFIQPTAVIADTATLTSLPDTEWRSGLAEVAKSAVLDGERFLAWLEGNAEAIVTREPAVIEEAVRTCVAFKARIVSNDERESGLREILNLGHTLGHAIEKVAGYGVVPHGIAVAEGMRFAATLAEGLVDAEPEFTVRQGRLMDALGLSAIDAVYDIEDIRAAISSDKKVREGSPRFVLAAAPGDIRVESVPDDVLMAGLIAFFGKEGEAQ